MQQSEWPQNQYKKSVVFLYTNSESQENEIIVSIPYKLVSKTIKHISIILIIKVIDLTKETSKCYLINSMFSKTKF